MAGDIVIRARTYRYLAATAALLAAPSLLAAQSQRSMLVRTDRGIADSSWNTGLQSAVRSVASPEAVLLWPGTQVVQGRFAIQRLLTVVQGDRNTTRRLAEPLAPDSIRVTWQPLGAEVSADSSLGSTWGVTVSAPTGAESPVIGRYVATWQRDVSKMASPWRLAALMFTEVTADGAARAVAGLPVELPSVAGTGKTAPFIAADLAFARLAGDSGAEIAFERWAAPDAHMFAGGGLLVEGPRAIARLMSAPAKWTWHPVAAGAADDGSMGWTVGEAVITSADGHAGPSKYLTVWKRQPDGSIRYFTDGGNGRPAAQ